MTKSDRSRSRPQPPRRRRAPRPEERIVDAERSRRALLDAALDEFSAHGFSGARVRDIADRAGVSKDLINYHFGGKDGLYREVQRQWLERESTFYDPDASLAELVDRYLHHVFDDPRPMRLVAWRGLAAPSDQPPNLPRETDELASMRRRQQRGEIASELDPATLQLVLLAAVAAPVLMPQAASRLFGIDSTDPHFETRYGDGLRSLVKRLGP